MLSTSSPLIWCRLCVWIRIGLIQSYLDKLSSLNSASWDKDNVFLSEIWPYWMRFKLNIVDWWCGNCSLWNSRFSPNRLVINCRLTSCFCVDWRVVWWIDLVLTHELMLCDMQVAFPLHLMMLWESYLGWFLVFKLFELTHEWWKIKYEIWPQHKWSSSRYSHFQSLTRERKIKHFEVLISIFL